jgi:hypothetical protein
MKFWSNFSSTEESHIHVSFKHKTELPFNRIHQKYLEHNSTLSTNLGQVLTQLTHHEIAANVHAAQTHKLTQIPHTNRVVKKRHEIDTPLYVQHFQKTTMAQVGHASE